jgi:multiple sugar transport system substrate-binding protein
MRHKSSGRMLARLAKVLAFGLLALGILSCNLLAKEITFWTWTTGPGQQAENETLDIFRQRHPNITLSYDTRNVRNGEALLLAVAGGAAPDLVCTHQDWHRDFAEIGAFLDLRPFIQRDKFNVGVFPKDLMGYFTSPNGEVTGFPWQFTTIVLAYNRALFDNQGLASPTNKWGLPDMVTAAWKLTIDAHGDGTPDTWGLQTGLLHEYVWRWWGVDMMSPDGQTCNLADHRAIAAFDWMAGLFVRDKVAHPVYGGGREFPDWVNGKLGMILTWPHYATAWGLHLADRWDVEELPTAPVGSKLARGATAGWAIPASAPNPDLAWEVLKFLASDEAQLSLLTSGRGGASSRAISKYWSQARSGGLGLKEPDSMRNIQALVNSYNYASIDSYPVGFANINTTILGPAVGRMLRGETSPQAELPQVAALVNARVRDGQGK